MSFYKAPFPSSKTLFGPTRELANTCPCRSCTDDRAPGCHAKCERYAEWRAALDAMKEQEIRAAANEANLNAYTVETKRKMQRRCQADAKKRKSRQKGLK